MAHVVLNACGETSATTGTGALTLANTAPANYGALQTLDTAITNGDAANSDTVDYHILDADESAWETGRGTITNSTTLTRTTVYRSTNSDNAVSLSAGTHTILFSPSADQLATTIIPSGATFPANAEAGQTWTLTLTNRTILYVYDGTNWGAVQSIGAMEMWVDDSSDESGFSQDEYGGDTTTTNDKFSVLQDAIDVIPPVLTGNVTVNVAAGSYTAPTIRGKAFSGDYTIDIIGERTYDEGDPTTLTCAGGAETVSTPGAARAATITYADIDLTDATSAAGGTYDLAADAAVADVHWIEIETTNECALILDHASTTRLEVMGAWSRAVEYGGTGGGVPAGTDECKIWHCGATVTGATTVTAGQQGVRFKRLALVGSSSTGGLKTDKNSFVFVSQCYISGGGNSRALFFSERGAGQVDNCFLTNTSNRAIHCTDSGSRVQLLNTMAWTSTNGDVMLAELGGSILGNVCCEAKGGSTADLWIRTTGGSLSAGQSATLWTKGASPSSEVGLTLTKSTVGKNTNGTYNDFDDVSVDAAADES